MPSEYISVSIALAPCSTCSGCTRIGSPISNVTAGMPASLAARRSEPRSPTLCRTTVAPNACVMRVDLRHAQIGAHLRQVGAIERAGVQIDQRGAVAHDFREERVRHARRGAALRIAGEVAIQIAPVRQVARAAVEALDVDDRHADHCAVQLFDVDVVEHAPRDFDAVELIAVHRRGQAQHGSRAFAVEHDHRHRHDEAFHRRAAGPGEPLAACPAALRAEQAHAALRLERRRCRGLGRCDRLRVASCARRDDAARAPARRDDRARPPHRATFTNFSVKRSLSPIAA